jgi:GntR family transcriptional regulator
MPVDPYSDVPLFEQVAAILRERITSGELARLELLPSETHLAQELGVGRDTVRTALTVLRDEGLVFTIKARGTFVGPRPG